MLTLLGIGVTVGAWLMPRFAERGASVYEAPGLTPGVLGIALTISGIALFTRRNAEHNQPEFWSAIMGSPDTRKRAGLALFLTLLYGAALFGRMPYTLATSLFVFAFILMFEWPVFVAAAQTSWQRAVRVSVAVAIGLLTGVVTHYLFQSVFLVQLP